MTKTSKDVYEVGKAYLVETVTKYWLGKIVRVTPTELVLETAGWVADTGRYNVTLREGLRRRGYEEYEPVPGQVIIGRGSIVNVVEWQHEIPKEVVQ